MPNNNPAGHNQYTKHKDQQQGAASSMQSAEPTSADPTQSSSDTASSVPSANPAPARRGFAAMDEQRTIASKGGQSQGKANNPGNFANDRDRAREAGRKGGESHGGDR